VRAAQTAEWPGNIRQLAHAVEAAVIRAAGMGASQVERSHLFTEGEPDAAPSGGRQSFQDATRAFHARLMKEALEETGWNVSETARRLDLTRGHVYNLIRAHGLARS
jgi:Nif-specific regulatory protein